MDAWTQNSEVSETLWLNEVLRGNQGDSKGSPVDRSKISQSERKQSTVHEKIVYHVAVGDMSARTVSISAYTSKDEISADGLGLVQWIRRTSGLLKYRKGGSLE